MRKSIGFLALLLAPGLLAAPAFAQAQKPAPPKKQDGAEKPKETKGTPETEKLKGRRVMVTKEGAEIKTREGGTVWRSYLGEVMTVSLVNGEWLWIFERQGWLHSKHVVPDETAIYEMNKRIKRSKRVENFALRGIAMVNHKRYEDAVKDFNEVIRRNPNDAGVYVNRGNTFRLMKKYSRAIDDYSKAINLDNSHFLAMNNRAVVQTKLKNYDLALKDLQAAVVLNKEYPEAHNNMGVVFEEKKDYKSAEVEFSQAIKLYPKYVEAYSNRAMVNSKLGEYEQARKDLSQAIILAPNDKDVLNDFAWFLSTCKDKEYRNAEKALSMAKIANELTLEKDWNVLDTYGAAQAEAGKWAQAERFAEKALTVAPDAEQPRIRRHIASYRQRRPIRE